MIRIISELGTLVNVSLAQYVYYEEYEGIFNVWASFPNDSSEEFGVHLKSFKTKNDATEYIKDLAERIEKDEHSNCD